MATLKSFQARIRRRARKLPQLAGNGVDQVAIAVTGALAEGTPKDTTLARSNWVVQRGSPDLSIRAPRSPADVVGEAIGKLQGRPTAENEEVHVSNGGDKVPYLSLLNDGHSEQAPAGFVRAAISVGIGVARKVRLLTGQSSFTARVTSGE